MSESQEFDQAVDRLLRDESPAASAVNLDDDEQRMLQMAQLLRGSSGGAKPSKQFSDTLRGQLNASGARAGSISRRTAVVSGLGALAAGVLAGLGIEHEVGGNKNTVASQPNERLVGANGRWTHVAHLGEVPEGSVMAFTAGSVAGFLIHRNGQIRALSRVCTHMGCLLTHEAGGKGFMCPCHGAEFSVKGEYVSGTYPSKLAPLPKLKLRVQNTSIQVWSA